ncbi:hypothetical protein CVT25_007433 [Psilocybe cyanescens]|uniref:Protein YOP1 n=1 Tax=Psilocybe cyanescens TaxID=93625 RepID=A0A409XVM9_PSICY|nr:hypothetical protein CVT25_007433 [Psilocybe cyanescens]
MALFVPVLRLLMLFLNVYDSYKTLKNPPPSSRNSGRPSIRAVSQRKRDMKGCLAVWIVWTSLSIYERTMESLVCLFIPFYDEFKSLALLFLILTRARGAEPIYLHLIRPLIKPYTGTLDATLELMLMIGDFVLALSTYPIRVGLEWYRKRFGSHSEAFETEETQSGSTSSNEVNTSELPTSFLATSGAGPVPTENDVPQLPKKTIQEKTRIQPPSRRTSGDTAASRTSSSRKKPEASVNPNIEPNFFNSKRARDPLNIRSGSPPEKVTKSSSHHRSSGDSSHRTPVKPSKHTRELAEGSSSRHQIWYPPSSPYEDEDRPDQADITIRAKQVEQAALLALEHQQYEEWRQYPAFPSAYPPTPLVATSTLATGAGPLNLHPTIAEETQQDFPQSLLPPREPLNPNHAGDLSDRHNIFGITSSPDVDDADDSMSTDDEDGYEDEDEFNITLRTPLPPFGSLRSQIQPRRLVSLTSTSSAVSVPSRSSALTTADNGSALPLGTSSDSSAPKPSLSPSVIGKKRSYPRTRMPLAKNRVRQIEDETSQDPSSSDHELQEVVATLKARDRKSSTSSLLKLSDESAAASPSSLSAAEQQEQQEPIPPEEKRRKIVRSVPPRAVHPSRPVRSRLPRNASLSPQSQKGKTAVLPGATIKRVSVQSGAGSSPDRVKGNDASLSASSASVSDAPRPRPGPSKPTKRTIARKP